MSRKNLLELKSVNEKYNFTVNLLNPHQNKKEIITLISFVNKIKPKTFCEIGTACGGTNLLISQCVESLEKVAGIDLEMRNTHKLKYYLNHLNHCYIRSNSSCLKTLNTISDFFINDGIDFLFIDGDHTYGGVKKDFELYSPLVNKSGIIAFHDIIPDFQTKYGKRTGNYAGDVPIFWNEIKKFYRYEEIFISPKQDGLGIGILYVD
ncbi:class I SAM-dependent methyltransferase [Opitutales bacterium]|nr:class I SAM-dependent methyltransferase [Opitutales bacterium]